MRAALYTLIARIRGYLRRHAHDAEFDEELAFHLAAAEEEARHRGLSPEEARRAARLQLGGLAQLREASRAASGLPWLDSLSVDVRLGVRLLRKYPGLTVVSTLALAIAIAIVAGFHAGTEFMVRPTLPLPDGERIVGIWNHDLRANDRAEQTVGDMLVWRRELASLRDVGAYARQGRVVATASGATRLVRSAETSPSVLQLARIPPLLGRPLVDADAWPGGAPVVVLGFDLWQSAFGGDAAIVGTPIQVGGIGHTVVGIMPAGFRFPQNEEMWTPLRVASESAGPGEGPAVEFAVGRLAPGVTLAEARAELAVIGARVAADAPAMRGGLVPRMNGYARSLLDAGEPGLATAMSAARVLIGIVLFVVAVNVATLVYARDAARVGEVALRTALGASRGRILLQMSLEALVLALLAAAIGLAIMAWPLHQLGGMFETVIARGDGPFWFDVRMGPQAILLVVALVIVSAALTGTLPALKLTSRDMLSALQHVQAGVSGLRFGTLTTLVVVSQVAISVALLTVGASQLGAFAADLASLADDPFDPRQYLTAQLRWDMAAGASRVAAEETRRRDGARRALGQGLAAEPDVRGVTFDAFSGVRPFSVTGIAAGPPAASSYSFVMAIESSFFDVYGTPLRAGRTFEAVDETADTRPVAIVNEEFVRTVLPGGTPIGRRIHPVDPRSGRPVGESVEIVGVVGDVVDLEFSERGPGWSATPTVYVPLRPTTMPIRMTVRVDDDPAQAIRRLQAIAARIDPTVVVHRPTPLEDTEEADRLFVRIYAFGVGFLVVAILLLSTAGVYSMLSFTVAQRTREIGIRTALGASPRRVMADVFRRAFVQVGSGTALGLTIAWLASSGPFRLSDGVFEHGPAVMIGVAATMLAAGVIACAAPLRRALRVQPTHAMRTE